MTNRLRRLFGSPTQNNDQVGGGSSDFSNRDTPTIFKAFGYNNRTLRVTGSINQPNSDSTDDELTADQDDVTILPRSSGEFSLMLSEQTSLDRRSSFLTSYYGSSASPRIAHMQQSFTFAPSFQSQSPFQPSQEFLARLVSPHSHSHKISASSVSSGIPFQNAGRLPTIEEGKLSVSIDFGTTFSGVAFGSSRIAGVGVQQILHWPSSFETFRKIPTCLLYDEHGVLLAWGLEAKNAPHIPGTILCEGKPPFPWFKLFLEPKFLHGDMVDPRLPRLPPGKRPIDPIVDFLSCLWDYARPQITRAIGAVADLDTADVWLTVPVAWDAKSCDLIREAAIQAGLVRAAGPIGQDKNWRDRLRIITEPEAAAVHCAHLTNLHQLRPSQNFMICDAGSESVDITVYKILGSLERLEIGEVCARSGANCGSLYLDLRFRYLVARMLERHPAHTDPSSLAYFQHTFSGTGKLAFRGEEDDRTPFQFNCFNIEDQNDPTVGLINGELTIPGALLRSEVFDPIISKVLQLIEDQLAPSNHPIHALLLVGGFSENEYLFKSIDQRFGTRISMIARPTDADTAACRGAARYGIANRALVSNIVVPKTYIMEATLPAEQEDWQKRPAYINISNTGVPLCRNRLQYLTRKGDILRKGERAKATFCKFSHSSEDFMVMMKLYTSDSEHIMRYTDESEATELCVICKWTIDLSLLPAFHENAKTGSQSDFYTEFEIGLEINGAAVQLVLLCNDNEWGRAVLDFLH